MATLRPPVAAVGGWEQGGRGPPPSPKAANRARGDGDHQTKPKPPSTKSASAGPLPKTPKESSVDDAAAELMSYLETTSSALSASARTAEKEASEARENARAALQIAQNYSLSGTGKSSSHDGAVLPSSPGGKKRKNPLLAAASTTTPTVSGVVPPPLVPPAVGVGVGVGATPAGTGTARTLTAHRGHAPPSPRPPSSVGTGGRAQITTPTAGAAPSPPSSTSRLAQSHAEDVLSLALEVETLRSQLENERQSHDRTRSLLASEKTRSEELEEDLRTTTKELDATVERNRRESERRSRELEVAVAKSVAAEEDAALALDLAKAANEGRERMEGWLNAAMEEIERLKAGGGGGNAEDVGAQDTTTEEALLAAARVRHEIEVEEEGERGAHPHNPGELLKRDSSIFHHTHTPSNEKRGNDVGGRAPETTIFDPSAAAAAGSSASARAAGGGAAIPEHASFDPLADDEDDEEEEMSSSYGVGYDDAPTDVSLAGDMTDDADASLTTVGTNPSLGTPGGAGGAGLAYVFATGDGGDDDVGDEGDKEGVKEEEDDGFGDAPASAPATATPPTGNNVGPRRPGEGGGAPKAMVAVGRDLLLRRTAATASGNAAGDPASRSPSSMAYRVSLAKIAERRTRLHERLNRAGAAADVELEGGGGSPAAASTSSPGEHLSQRRGVDLGRHRIYLTSASADKVLELLRDSGRRLRLGRNFVLTDTVGDVGGGFFGSGEDDIGGRSPSGGGTGAGAVDAEEDERMETGRSTLSNIEGIAANYCRAVEAKVNLQREECRQLESLCEYLERKVVESDFGQDLA